MTFASPQILWLLLVFPPALLAFFWWSARRREVLIAQFIQSRLLPGLLSGVSPLRQKIRAGCLIAAVVCLILALARPQAGFDWEEVKQRGLDIIVAIDTSKSMLAEDIAPNRLARAKLAALDLMQQARSDRLGLVAFAGKAFLQCPLTIDDSAFRQSVEALDVNTIPQGGTAIAEAIETAQNSFKEGDNHRVLVLMTDGEDHDSGALEAAQKAAQAGMQIFTIGIGTAEGELLRVKNADGNSDYVRDEQGNVVKSHLDENLLRQIAGATEKGFYLPLRGARSIDTLYEKGLAPLPKSESSEKLVKRLKERYYWPLSFAILFLLIELLFPERKPDRKPAGQTRTPAAPVRGNSSPRPLVGAALLLLALPFFASASPSSALREYKAGQYDDALKEYQQLLQKKKDDPRLHFNAGAAAYRDQKFDEAAKQFDQALSSPDLKLQGLAYYNRGNSLFRLGENLPDPEKKTEAWQKSLQDFESSMKLSPQDADSKYNHEFVKKMLEELKKQQQQQQKNDKQNKNDQQKNQDQQQQQQQQQQNQSKQDQNQQQQSQQQQSQQQQQQQQQQASQQQQQQAEDEQKKQEAAKQAQEKKQQAQQQAQASAGQKQEKNGEKDEEQASAAGQMTPEQAEQLLDAQKGDEQMLQLKPEEKQSDSNRPFKDW